MIDLDIIRGFRSEDEVFFKKFYKEYRNEFVKFLTNRGLSQEEAVEIFHECILILKRKACNNELAKVQVGLKTYLFAIGKHKAFDHFHKKQKSMIQFQDNLPEILDESSIEDEQLALILQIKERLAIMGKACKKLLTSFYLEGLTITELVKSGNYHNENTVRAQKSRCLKQLRETLTKHPNG
jgi:RNA polymerase sigma factor (sigma-70 family)